MIRFISKHSQLAPSISTMSRYFSSLSNHPLFLTAQKSSKGLKLKYIENISKLSSLSNHELTSMSNDFSMKPRYLKTEKDYCIGLFNELVSRYENDTLSFEEFINSTKVLNAYPEMTSKLASVLDSKIHHTSPFMSMHHIAQLIDLVFYTYKCSDYELFSRAVNVFNSRCCHLHTSIELVEVFEICLRLHLLYEPVSKVINKLQYFIQSKIEIDSFDEIVKLAGKLKDCEEYNHRLFISLPIKHYVYLNKSEKDNIPASKQMVYIYEIVQTLKKKMVFISLSLKSNLLFDLEKKVDKQSLHNMNFGVLLDAALYLSTTLNKDFIRLFEDVFKMQRKIDYNYALCYSNILIFKNITPIKITEQQELEIEMLPITDCIKILNLSNQPKEANDNFFKKLSVITLRVLTKASMSEDNEKSFTILEYIDNNFISKKTLASLSKVIESCLSCIYKNRKLFSNDRYYKILFRMYKYSPKQIHHYIEDFCQEISKPELISLLRQKFNLSPSILATFYESFPEFSDSEKLYSVLVNLNTGTTIKEFVESRKLMNKLHGSVYMMEDFEIHIIRWFKYIHDKNISCYINTFLSNLNKFMVNLPESELGTSKAFNVAKMLRDLNCLDDSLAEKIALAHIDNYSDDQLGYLSIAFRSKNPEIQEIIKKVIMPEFLYTWLSFDVRITINRIKIANRIIKFYPEYEKNILNVIEQKMSKWFHLYAENFIEILESLNDEEYCENPEIIKIVVENISKRIFRDDISVRVKLLTVYFELLSKFNIKDRKYLKQFFIDIGKNYFKISMELKVNILKSLGLSGLANKELFKIIFIDLEKFNDPSISIVTDALTALCDCNLEDSDFAAPIYNFLISKLYTELKFMTIFNAKLYFCLVKPGRYKNEILDMLKVIEMSPNFYHDQPQRFLISCYLMDSENLKIIKDEEFSEWNEIITDFCLWKINPLEIERARNVVKGLGFEPEVLTTVDKIRVPLFIRETGTVIVPRTEFNTIINSESLRGEQACIVKALQNHGYKVRVHDFSTPFTLNT